MRIGSSQTAEIGAVADTDARDEESHRMPLSAALLLAILRQRQVRPGKYRQNECRKRISGPIHQCLLAVGRE